MSTGVPMVPISGPNRGIFSKVNGPGPLGSGGHSHTSFSNGRFWVAQRTLQYDVPHQWKDEIRNFGLSLTTYKYSFKMCHRWTFVKADSTWPLTALKMSELISISNLGDVKAKWVLTRQGLHGIGIGSNSCWWEIFCHWGNTVKDAWNAEKCEVSGRMQNKWCKFIAASSLPSYFPPKQPPAFPVRIACSPSQPCLARSWCSFCSSKSY